MPTAATVHADAATTAPSHARNHLATSIVVTLYVALLVALLVLCVRDLRAPTITSRPAGGLPTAGSSAGHLIPAPPLMTAPGGVTPPNFTREATP